MRSEIRDYGLRIIIHHGRRFNVHAPVKEITKAKKVRIHSLKYAGWVFIISELMDEPYMDDLRPLLLLIRGTNTKQGRKRALSEFRTHHNGK